MKSVWLNRTLVLATYNSGKIAEITNYLAPLHLHILTARDISFPEPIETENSFEGNAALKARAAMKATGHATIADDSGLMITALNGDPGVYSADWAGPEKDFTHAMKRVQNLMCDAQDFTAKFVTVMALCDQNEEVIFTRGEVEGHIRFPAIGTQGFGYDPIFVPQGETRSFGEMSIVEKKSYSHRIRALEKLLDVMLSA